MSEFYGWLQGNRGETTRGGSLKSGVWAKIQSWFNTCSIQMIRDGDNDILHISISKKQDGKKLKIFLDNVEINQEDFELIRQNGEEFNKFLTNLRVLKSL